MTLYRYTWLFINLVDFSNPVLQCVTLCYFGWPFFTVWLYFTLKDSIGICMTLHDPVCLSMTLYYLVWLWMTLLESVILTLILFGSIREKESNFKNFYILLKTFSTYFHAFQQTSTLFTFVYLCSNDASMHKFCACFGKET